MDYETMDYGITNYKQEILERLEDINKSLVMIAGALRSIVYGKDAIINEEWN